MLCSLPAAVVHVVAPTGRAHVDRGHVVLANDTRFVNDNTGDSIFTFGTAGGERAK
jgi:hypothetical protein